MTYKEDFGPRLAFARRKGASGKGTARRDVAELPRSGAFGKGVRASVACV